LYLNDPSESSTLIAIQVVFAPNGEVHTHHQLSVQSVNVHHIFHLIAFANHDCHGVRAVTHVVEKYTWQFVQVYVQPSHEKLLLELIDPHTYASVNVVHTGILSTIHVFVEPVDQDHFTLTA
jgi:hypothetical protein